MDYVGYSNESFRLQNPLRVPSPIRRTDPCVKFKLPAKICDKTQSRMTQVAQSVPFVTSSSPPGSRSAVRCPATPVILPEGSSAPPGSRAVPKNNVTYRSSALSANAVSVTNLPRIYQTFPRILPFAPDIPPRVNPLNPPRVRRTFVLETGEPHFRNEQRALRMKQRDHYRYHNSWSKFYYGNMAEREAYNAYQRAVLKQQMADKERLKVQHFSARVRESEEADELKRNAEEEEVKEVEQKKKQMRQFRDENKRIMEWQWNTRQQTKIDEDMFDREVLKFNPLNWSGSLK